MKVLLYFEHHEAFKRSGIGRARKHQTLALKSQGIEVTYDPEDSYDLAHINTYGAGSYRLLKHCLKRHIPVVVHGHSTKEDFKESFTCYKLMEPFFFASLKRMYGHAPLIITPTPHSKRNIDNYHLCSDVRAVSNGIDLKEYAYDQSKIDDFRKRFDIKENEKFVMGVGFPFVRKGYVDFMEVAKSFPKTKFIWFGALPKVAMSSAVRKAIRHKPDNVILPGYVDGRLIQGAYLSTSCMFFPSYEENEGIVVLEALVSKCPLLVRDIDTYNPWLKKDVHCRMGSNNEDFVKELTRLLNEGENPEIIENAYEVAKERSIEKIGEQLKAIYLEAINNQTIK